MVRDDEFQTEVSALRQRLTAIAIHYVGPDDAEDVVQDALVKLWTMRLRLHSPLAPLASLIVRQLCVDRLRVQSRTSELLDRLDNSVSRRLFAEEEQENCQNEMLDQMMRIISALPPTQSLILRLRHIEGMEFADISRLTGMKEPAVRKALSRARLAVKDAFLAHSVPK